MSSVQILKVENVNVEIFSRLEEKRVEENNSILSPLCGNNRSYIDTPLLFLRHKQGFSRFRIHFLFRLVHTDCDGSLFFLTSSTRVQIFSVSECRQVPKVLFTSGQEGRSIRTQSKNLKTTHPGFTVKMWKDAYFRAVGVMN